MEYRTFIICILISLSSLVGCSSNGIEKSSDITLEKANDAVEAPQSKRVYYLQHKLISSWVFESEGAFFFDLYNRNYGQLIDAASEMVSPEYAKEIVVTPLYDRNAVVIKFPEPSSMANCYFALVKKEGDTYSYYTYEKTMNFGNDRIVGVLGGWNAEGGHSNYGPRGYKLESDFIKDVLGPPKNG